MMKSYILKNILLCGPDGVGKSTIAVELKSLYRKKGIPVVIVWARFHHYLQRAVNLFARMTGKSYDVTYSWGRDNYHDYQGFIGVIYIYAAFIDHIIFIVFFKKKMFMRGAFCIVDRYIIDIVADLIVDTNRPKLVFALFDRFISKELKNFNIFILECDVRIVESRRIDIKDDKKYLDKIKAYKLISDKYSINKINTGVSSISENVQKIVNK